MRGRYPWISVSPGPGFGSDYLLYPGEDAFLVCDKSCVRVDATTGLVRNLCEDEFFLAFELPVVNVTSWSIWSRDNYKNGRIPRIWGFSSQDKRDKRAEFTAAEAERQADWFEHTVQLEKKEAPYR
ncbi:hypothetical protein A3K42_01130 [candidate division WWE3 bacterium RBG_13_37_7]|uniref:Uncharacterized protein n=1 Tax=candidate division WWE3 bacterium RBG_13_37_7 TaxID=1802609 RepID=A0A1F4U1B5_UNCKA|nr:MAG: hypothetical protein A3K42_01130 [candidate division WWE3 bacterium RBG_13_37_7]